MVNFEEYFEYDPEGFIRWRVRRGQRGNPGEIAGCRQTRGYWTVGLLGRSYNVHGIVWYLHRGLYPSYQKDEVIDHIDGNPSNNKIANLRLVTTPQNQQNTKLRVDSTSGVKGVSFITRFNKWCARININKKRTFIGYFRTFEEAKEARLEAEKVHYPCRKQ